MKVPSVSSIGLLMVIRVKSFFPPTTLLIFPRLFRVALEREILQDDDGHKIILYTVCVCALFG